MRHLFRILLIPGIFAATFLTQSETAEAREYPWCARYDWTTYNCGFVTLQQCLATISGDFGARCERNPRYNLQRPRR